MRKLYAFLICALFALTAHALPARVQTCTGNSASGVTATCTMTVSTGNLVVVFGGDDTGSDLSGTISGSGGCSGTFTNLGKQFDGTSSQGQFIWSTPVSSAASCTISWTGSAAKSLIGYELSGVNTSTTPNDGAPAFAVTGVFSSPGPVTVAMTATSNTNDILLGAITTSDTTNFVYTTVQSGWTADAAVTTNVFSKSEYRVVSATGSYTAGWSTVTQTGGGGRYLRVAAVAIKDASAPTYVSNPWVIN